MDYTTKTLWWASIGLTVLVGVLGLMVIDKRDLPDKSSITGIPYQVKVADFNTRFDIKVEGQEYRLVFASGLNSTPIFYSFMNNHSITLNGYYGIQGTDRCFFVTSVLESNLGQD